MRRLLRVSLFAMLLTGNLSAGADVPAAGGERAAIPFRSAEGPSGSALVGRVLAGFVLVLVVGVGAVYLLKRYAPGIYSYRAAGGQRIEVLEIRRVTPRLTLFLVKMDSDEVLLAQSGDRIKSVWQRPAKNERGAERRDV